MTKILMISGSTRQGSVNSAVLNSAVDLLPIGVSTTVYSGISDLPHFNPDMDRDPLPASVVELRRLIDEASCLFISTPEYAGAMPGALKNLLEWTVGGTEIAQKPAGWVNPSTMGDRAAKTYTSLRTVLEYTGAQIVEEACVSAEVPRLLIDSDGIVRDKEVRASISRALLALVASVK